MSITRIKLLPVLGERTGMASLINTQDTQELRQQVFFSRLLTLSFQSHAEKSSSNTQGEWENVFYRWQLFWKGFMTQGCNSEIPSFIKRESRQVEKEKQSGPFK